MTRGRFVKRLTLVPLAAMIVVTAGLTPTGRDGPTPNAAGSERPVLHIELRTSTPAEGDTVRAALDAITLEFSDAVEPRLGGQCGVTLNPPYPAGTPPA